MLIDTHAHIYLEQFQDDLDEVISRAREAGIEKIVMPAIDVNSIRRGLDLCDRYEGLSMMAALHPSETRDATEEDFEEVVRLSEDERVVAIGETGLDYYWDRSFDARQHDLLRRHIRLAAERDLPLVFHNRESFNDLIRIVEEEKEASLKPERIRGIFHCFTGSPEEADRVSRSGFLLGIGGVLTFKNSSLSESVRDIPLDRIVLETDAPYLAPVPHRGKRNEPAYVRLVAEKMSEVKDSTVEEVARITSENARAIFGLT